MFLPIEGTELRELTTPLATAWPGEPPQFGGLRGGWSRKYGDSLICLATEIGRASISILPACKSPLAERNTNVTKL